jgi:putative transposase
LVKLGEAVGPKVTWLLTIVSYQTYRRWAHQLVGGGPTPKKSTRKLVLKLARENSWGYTRILGELRKPGIKTSRTNVVNILRENKIDPKLDSKKGCWADFFKSHANTLWQCDFFSKHLVTTKGMRQCFMLAFLHVATRKVFLTPCTFKPALPNF